MLDRDAGIPFAPETLASQKLYQECLNRKLVLRPVTVEGSHTLAIAPPLIINKQQIEQMISIISDSLSVVEKQL